MGDVWQMQEWSAGLLLNAPWSHGRRTGYERSTLRARLYVDDSCIFWSSCFEGVKRCGVCEPSELKTTRQGDRYFTSSPPANSGGRGLLSDLVGLPRVFSAARIKKVDHPGNAEAHGACRINEISRRVLVERDAKIDLTRLQIAIRHAHRQETEEERCVATAKEPTSLQDSGAARRRGIRLRAARKATLVEAV